MADNTAELDKLQAAYKQVAENWIAAIREEVALASVAHNVAEIDTWEDAHEKQENMRQQVEETKQIYEDALRQERFGF